GGQDDSDSLTEHVLVDGPQCRLHPRPTPHLHTLGLAFMWVSGEHGWRRPSGLTGASRTRGWGFESAGTVVLPTCPGGPGEPHRWNRPCPGPAVSVAGLHGPL